MGRQSSSLLVSKRVAVAIWRKCDIDPAGMDTLKVTTDI
jgi:hypothetical protein